jgi:hypothetical protein
MVDDPTHAAFDSWLGTNLDTYMIDIYDYNTGVFRNADGTLSQTKINTRMDNYLTAFKTATTATAPLIHITETNSPMDSHRKNWFLFLTEWMSTHNGFRIVSHWNPTGPDSGPWPPSATVRDYFVFLQATYGA